MSRFKVNLTAINPVERHRRTPPVEALVDTGAHSSWLPISAAALSRVPPFRARQTEQ